MHRLISGNSYVLGITVSTKRVMELKNLRPDRIEIKTGNNNIPASYDYSINGKTYRFPIDPDTLQSDVLHIKEPHPSNDLYGLSPIQAAFMAIDQHNEAAEWNKKLLENSARPPGVFSLKNHENVVPISPEQVQQISDSFKEKFAGSENAGKPLFINADMVWQSMGMSPTDMDWLNGKNTSARDICLAFGYPALLLGMPEGATFSNVGEAKMSLYEETVIPLVQNVFSEISYYLSNKTGKNIEIVADLDQVSALMPRRLIARQNARDDMNAGLITPNEARVEIGYDPVVGGDD
jgi:HK97 family phage portal protein